MALTDGSEAHHVTMQEFHRQAIAQLHDLQENTGSATPSRRVETEGPQTFEATGVADTHRVRAGGNVSGAEECQTATVGDVHRIELWMPNTQPLIRWVEYCLQGHHQALRVCFGRTLHIEVFAMFRCFECRAPTVV